MKVNNDAASIRKELNQLDARRSALKKQLTRLENLDNERLDKVQRLTEIYKPKFATLQTDLIYSKEIESWWITPKGEDQIIVKHYLCALKEEDMDKVFNNLSIALYIRGLLPDFKLRNVSFMPDMAVLYNEDDDITLQVSKKGDYFVIKLIKQTSDDFYTFKLGNNLSLEASSEEDYVDLKFVYQFSDAMSGLAAGIKRGLKELSKFPS